MIRSIKDKVFKLSEVLVVVKLCTDCAATEFTCFRCKIPLVLRESHHLQRLGVRIRLLGKKELIAEDLRTQFELLEKSTEANRGSVLNICFAYTSTQEICDAVNKVKYIKR